MLVQSNLALVASTNERQITLYELFEEYIKNYHYSNNSKYNAMHYIKKLKEYFRDIDILDITKEHIQEYVNYLYYIENLSDSYVYILFQRLNAVLNYAVRQNYLEYNVCKYVSIKKIRYVNRDIDFSKKFIKKILNIFKNTKLHAIVYFDLHTRT